MLRHTRSHSRYQRQRYIARRRREFQGWVGKTDPARIREEGDYVRIQPPRSRALRESEFWQPRTLGKLAKWNGTCSHVLCKGPRTRDRRQVAKSEARRMALEIMAKAGADSPDVVSGSWGRA